MYLFIYLFSFGLPHLDCFESTAVACSFSPEALTSLSSFTESLSLCMGFLARAKRLSALCFNSADGSMVIRSGNPARRSNSRRRSSVGGRRRSLAGGALEDGPTTDVWTVAIDLRKVDALLTMLKQLDDQESAGYLMAAGNQVGFRGVFVCIHSLGPRIAVWCFSAIVFFFFGVMICSF